MVAVLFIGFLTAFALVCWMIVGDESAKRRAFAALVLLIAAEIAGRWLLFANDPNANQRYCLKSTYVEKQLQTGDETHWACVEWAR